MAAMFLCDSALLDCRLEEFRRQEWGGMPGSRLSCGKGGRAFTWVRSHRKDLWSESSSCRKRIDQINLKEDGVETMKKHTAQAVGISLMMLMGDHAVATENGLTSYPIGVNTVLDGVLPPPGATQFYSYTQYYVTNQFSGNQGQGIVPGFRTSLVAEAPRVIHTWSPLFGPFTISSGMVVPIFHLSTRVAGMSGTNTGIGDITISPLYIGYKNAESTVFSYLGLDITVPSGAYSASRVDNLGRNVFAFVPNFNLTVFPRREIEASLSVNVEFDTKNGSTNYQSGNVASLEYLLGYSITPQIQLGIQGYILSQFSDDRQSDVIVGDGFRGRAIGFGPQVRYNFSPTSAIVFKYQHEIAVRNRATGDRLWVELTFPIK
jgi:hypothetical protein